MEDAQLKKFAFNIDQPVASVGMSVSRIYAFWDAYRNDETISIRGARDATNRLCCHTALSAVDGAA